MTWVIQSSELAMGTKAGNAISLVQSDKQIPLAIKDYIVACILRVVSYSEGTEDNTIVRVTGSGHMPAEGAFMASFCDVRVEMVL